MPVFADKSKRIEAFPQVALASYSRGDLWIQSRFFQAMSDEGRCGLSIHEAIRHLNATIARHSPLTTAEIETVTARWMSDASAAEATLSERVKIVLPSELKRMGTAVDEMISFLIEEKHQLPHPAKVDSIYDQARATYFSLLRTALGDGETKGHVVANSLSNEGLSLAQAISDYRLENQAFLSARQRDLLAVLTNQIHNEFDRLSGASVVSSWDQVVIPDNLVGRLFYQTGITEKLPGLKVLDVRDSQIKTRPF